MRNDTLKIKPLLSFNSSTFLQFSAMALLLCPLSKWYRVLTRVAVFFFTLPQSWEP